ncbi:hypothetical protein FOA52_008264 [Chlamydomonas sp. UWO 241]|nr:hypothetical protein FOA52_008264 [Chlamydomonas sp. UWO 241]
MECTVHDNTRGQSKKGGLARAVEQREQVRRVQEASRAEIEKFYGGQNVLQHMEKSTLIDDVKRREREAKERAVEGNMLDSLYQSEKHRELNRVRADEEERMAVALSKQMRERERKERELQQLREQSDELKQLTEKIRIARISKARAEQLVEKQTIRQQERKYDETFNKYIDEVDKAAEAKLMEHEGVRREQAVAARLVLEEQMKEKQDALLIAEDEFQRERAMVDEVVRRIHEEDAAEDASRRAQQDDTKAYIRNFLEGKEVEKVQKKVNLAAEDKKIADHWTAVRAREADESARKAAAREVADRMYEQVKHEMERDRAIREEEEYLINLLRDEEQQERRRQEEIKKREKAEKIRAEIIAANAQQKLLRIQREEAYAAEEEAYREELMAKFADQDRLEQLSAQKRRMKQAEHQRAVQAMIDDKRRRYMEQKARDEAEIAATRANDERRLAIVEEERARLLAEAAELREYLPRGVIRDQRDLELMNQLTSQRMAA